MQSSEQVPNPSGSSTVGTSSSSTAPSWLNISLDAALGFRANVFQINRTALPTGGKKSSALSGSSTTQPSSPENSISIHTGATSVVCRHTLEVLISLAKSFSTHFLPSASRQSPITQQGKTKNYPERDNLNTIDMSFMSTTITGTNKSAFIDNEKESGMY